MLYIADCIKKTGRFATLSEAQKNSEKSAINRLLAPYGASVTRYIESPRMIQYRAMLPASCNVTKLLKIQPNLCIALGDDTVNLYREKSELVIEKRGANNLVRIGDVLMNRFAAAQGLPIILGKDMQGNNVYTNLARAPHMLVAGTTGSGKSIFLHTIIDSLLISSAYTEIYTVDMKKTEFNQYSKVPTVHTITEVDEAIRILADLCKEMDARYDFLAKYNCRDIETALANNIDMMRKVVIIDEFADLMQTSKKDVEQYVVRLAQKARACGIHLVIATQRPSRETITGLIKTNIPTRVCLKVTSGIDSRIILDRLGGEKLIGHGDMLFLGNGAFEPIRIQGCFVDQEETCRIAQAAKAYLDAVDTQERDYQATLHMERRKAKEEAARRKHDREVWEREQKKRNLYRGLFHRGVKK